MQPVLPGSRFRKEKPHSQSSSSERQAGWPGWASAAGAGGWLSSGGCRGRCWARKAQRSIPAHPQLPAGFVAHVGSPRIWEVEKPPSQKSKGDVLPEPSARIKIPFPRSQRRELEWNNPAAVAGEAAAADGRGRAGREMSQRLGEGQMALLSPPGLGA